jgi:alanyl-tRNA synthetase
VLGSTEDGRVRLVAGVTNDLTGRIKAGPLVQEIAPTVGGKGGGPPNLGRGGGSNPAQLSAALEQALGVVARMLGGS